MKLLKNISERLQEKQPFLKMLTNKERRNYINLYKSVKIKKKDVSFLPVENELNQSLRGSPDQLQQQRNPVSSGSW